jgi:formamidopyrimidine-DNA glycosylase
MPELPDVEIFKQYLDSTSLHKNIERVQILAPEMLKGITAKKLKAAIEGHAFKATRRHGKYLFVSLENSSNLVLHFGMTGFVVYFKNMKKSPSHERLLISFSNDYHLVYDCQRKLGEVTLVESVDAFLKERKLGADALKLEFHDFGYLFSRTRSFIKSALMNQQVIAGIGNIYSDEMLFHAGIHPQKRGTQLDDNSLEALFRAMKEVLAAAIACRANPERFPDTYLIPHRRKDGICPQCGEAIKSAKVSGRTAYFCPHCQG